MAELKQVINRSFSSPSEVREVLKDGPCHFQNCNLSQLNLFSVCLDGCVFDQGTKLIRTILGKARNCEFWHCDLSRLDLRNADITGSSATDCLATGIRFFGHQMTFNCYFIRGLRSNEAIDGYRLIYWIALADTPQRQALLALIPPDIMPVLKLLFEDPASGSATSS